MVTSHQIPASSASSIDHHHAAPPKMMTTRTSTGSIPTKRDPDYGDSSNGGSSNSNSGNSNNGNVNGSQSYHNHYTAERRQQHHADDEAREDASSGQRDPSPPSPEGETTLTVSAEEFAAAAAANDAHVKSRKKRSSAHSNSNSNKNSNNKSNFKITTSYHHPQQQQQQQQYPQYQEDLPTPTLAGGPSFDQVMEPSTSFGGLSALGLGVTMSVDAHSAATAPTGTPGNGYLRQTGGLINIMRRSPSSSIPANLPMSELDNPSWDLLNQDSFGFNLLDSQGSLSFDTGEQQQATPVSVKQQHDNNAPGGNNTTGTGSNSGSKKDNNGNGNGNGNGNSVRDRIKSVDLTSAVTASLEHDTPSNHHKNGSLGSFTTALDWGNHAGGDTTIVNSMNHNWIPPHSPLQANPNNGGPSSHHPHHVYPPLSHHLGHPHHGHPPHPHHPHHPPPPHLHHPHGPGGPNGNYIHHHGLQESRSDIITGHHSRSYYGVGGAPPPLMDPTELRDSFLDDPFKYAFGDPSAVNAAAENFKQHPRYNTTNNSKQQHPNSNGGGGGSSKSTTNDGSRRGGSREGSGPTTSTSKGGRTSTTTSSNGRSASRSSNTSGERASSSNTSRRSKKRKHPPAMAQRQSSEPLDAIGGHHSPPALPTIESAPTATLDMLEMNPPIWGAPSTSPDTTRRRSNSGRSRSGRRGDKRTASSSRSHHYQHPDIGSSSRSSTWHAAPAPGYPPYPPHPSHPPHPSQQQRSADPIHSAFLPPVPTQPAPPPPSSGSSYGASTSSINAPPMEVYITTKSSSSSGDHQQQPGAVLSSGGIAPPPGPGPYGPMPPFGMHPHPGGPPHPPPYAYPPAPAPGARGGQRSRSGSGPAEPRGRGAAPAAAPPVSQRSAPQQTGLALLTLPDGAQLSRSQAPGIGWPPAEDLRLTEVMSNHKSSQVNWDTLCLEHGMGRTARECHDRWTRYLKPGSRKGQWREEEDAIVLRVIFASGGGGSIVGADVKGPGALAASEPHPPFTQWADLAPQLPGRTGKQIRDRWVNYLNPAINHLPFSREDDLRLWQGHKELGKRWVEISVKIFHSTRSENHIKNRWYSAAFKKFIAKEFGMDAYVDAKAAQGGVIGAVVQRDRTGAAAASNNNHHPNQPNHSQYAQPPQHHHQQHLSHGVRQVHGGNVRNGVLNITS